MGKEIKVKYFLRRSAFGLVAVSASVLVGSTVSAVDSPIEQPRIIPNGGTLTNLLGNAPEKLALRNEERAIDELKKQAIEDKEATTAIEAASSDALEALADQTDALQSEEAAVVKADNAASDALEALADQTDALQSEEAAVVKADNAASDALEALADQTDALQSEEAAVVQSDNAASDVLEALADQADTLQSEEAAAVQSDNAASDAWEKAATPIALDVKKTKDTKPVVKKEERQNVNTLPTTGEESNPFFTAAALAIMVSTGVLVVSSKCKEN
ncbi:TPA: LPXTG cell wall anchor domain-containing protein [Streptococcus pyogenes]|uniref:LPXTG cell wall anchor domain-containing protein n=1 Tax=Streptococcus pyogenes TaxID=1314 RepID=UPI000DA3204B|nr:LPXTG cell wall anchor domain-containing protein [Streptococcus pyogenes]SQE97722.1 surface-anchored protein (protein G-related alpha 2M-binding protein) [Streptococcus pyogenes]VGT13806.1 surface-anchored protein (protein G-related alpha 2M-binding protein) [Streptococcus pyogenes]VGT42166.1 surface-anchored protein (protein G-related alpha 2M-binding protein) [Streptococcus pyogenes]VHK00841.1 surface-anchored protein (protein G-related alpha 2M-binding protein) [Streptococcus pyogenes]VH